MKLLGIVSGPVHTRWGGGGVLSYMGYIGMCHCDGYGFQVFYSGIGYINERVWVQKRVSKRVSFSI